MTHKSKVGRISQSLQKYYEKDKEVLIYHGSSNSTRALKFKKEGILDISDLNQILSVNKRQRFVLTESNVPMDRLINETLKFNLIPPVVMEFPGITVGGGIQGGAGESSSFRYGAFHNCFSEYEVLLGNGQIINTSKSKNTDLHHGITCSYGSLGVIASAKLRLRPAKKFVKLTYYQVKKFKDAIELIKKMNSEKIDFLDGILFSKDLGTIMTGIFSDEANLPVSSFSKAWNDWFYIHAQKITKKYKTYSELIPIKEYLFRYDRGAFWVGSYPFKKLKIPFNKITRFLMDPLFKTRTLYRFLQAINVSQFFLIQDLALPGKNATKFLKYIDQKIGIYPIWLCPLKPNPKEKLSPVHLGEDFIVDIGVWGKIKSDYIFSLKLNRSIEKIIKKLGGKKILYAHQYYSKEEFWQIYDHKWYQNLRKKYHAEKIFPDIYEKTFVREKYKFSILKGLLDVLSSPFKLKVDK